MHRDKQKRQLLRDSVEYLKPYLTQSPQLAVTLGSGLGKFTQLMKIEHRIPYSHIPHYPLSTVPGHAGEMVIGKLSQVPIIALKGRVHYYEGYTLNQVTFPVQLLHALGVKYLLLTNASGGLNKDIPPGEFMLINAYINFAGLNPLPQGSIIEENIFSRRLNQVILNAAKKAGVALHQGAYCWTTGPSYETPAEVKLIAALGGDAVGMSTIPEALMAHHLGIDVSAIACITNWASGISSSPLSHQDVTATAEKVEQEYLKLMRKIIEQIGKDLLS